MPDRTNDDAGAGHVGDWANDVASRFDFYGRRIEKVEDKIVQHSLRIESLEDNSGKIAMLVTTITQLAERTREMADNVEATAERAVEKALARRDIELADAERAHRVERRNRWRSGARYTYSAMVGGVGALTYLAGHFHWF